jgi:hypothetical protein
MENKDIEIVIRTGTEERGARAIDWEDFGAVCFGGWRRITGLLLIRLA